MENYWDKEYPTHIEVPEDYWVYSYNNIKWDTDDKTFDS